MFFSKQNKFKKVDSKKYKVFLKDLFPIEIFLCDLLEHRIQKFYRLLYSM
jgi:hypothetical protein